MFRWLRSLPYPWAQAAWATPNGALHTPAMREYFWEEGMRPGVSDIVIPLASCGYTIFGGEMKYGDGKPSREQEEWAELILQLGGVVVIAWSARDMIALIKEYAEIL